MVVLVALRGHLSCQTVSFRSRVRPLKKTRRGRDMWLDLIRFIEHRMF